MWSPLVSTVGAHIWGGVNVGFGYTAHSAAIVGSYVSLRHQLEFYRFGSIHNILVSLFREHPETTHGHNATTW